MSEIPYTNDLDTLRNWVGRTAESADLVSPVSCRKLANTLGRDATLEVGDVLPPLWHFINHVDAVPIGDVGHDGHPQRGGFLPPVALPRRMWAGGRLTFHGDLLVGDTVTKRSTVEGVEMKEGRSGSLCFVSVRHELSVGGELRITEEQDLVYRDDPAPDAPKANAKASSRRRRLHRDGYAIGGHVVPLFGPSRSTVIASITTATMRGMSRGTRISFSTVHSPRPCSQTWQRSKTGARLASFSFRGMAPLFDDEPFTISGRRDGDELSLWATTPSGGIAMQASATLLDS